MKQDLRRSLGGGGNRVTLTNSEIEAQSSVNSLAPHRESGFAYGRSEASPDSEQIEHVIAEQFMRNSVSVEQIQDGLGRGGQDRARERGLRQKGAEWNSAPSNIIFVKSSVVRKGHQSPKQSA